MWVVVDLVRVPLPLPGIQRIRVERVHQLHELLLHGSCALTVYGIAAPPQSGRRLATGWR